MGLREIHIPKAAVQTSGGEFAVRGLSSTDLEHLFRECGPEMMAVFTKLVSGERKADLGIGDVRQLAGEAFRMAPNLIITAICLAADDDAPETREIVAKLPAGVQIDALIKLAILTLDGGGDSKKAGEIVGAAMGMLNEVLVGMAASAT